MYLDDNLLIRAKASILLYLLEVGYPVPQSVLDEYKYHPELASSNLPATGKLILQVLLEEKFDMDFERMLIDMEQYAASIENYESAALIRDYHKEFKNQML